MNVPKLRFKEFTDEYKSITFDKLANYKKGPFGSSLKKNMFVSKSENSIKVYEQQNAIKKDWTLERYFITKEYYEKLKGFTVKPGDIIVSCAGTIGEYYVLPYNAEIGIINQALMRIKTNNLINQNYFLYIFDNMVWHFSKTFSNGSAIKNIPPFSDLKKQIAYIPNMDEQNKVAHFLSLLDKKIKLQTKRIEALKLFKKGLLNFFFENKQPNVTIENCISYGKAGGTPSSYIKDYYDGNIPFLSISDMTSQRKYILKTEKSISQQGIRNSSAWVVPKNSIILSMYASYGLIAINKIELATSQAMFGMIVNSKNNIEYIYYYLEFLYNNNYYDRLVSIGTQANLNADKVKKIKIYLPDINSQNKISKILKLCDEKIENENKVEFELRKFKQGLMQNMFV